MTDDTEVAAQNAESGDVTGADAQDSPGSQQDASPSQSGSLATLATPDVSSLPPNSSTPTGSLDQLSPQNNPAQSTAQPQPTGPPTQGLGARLRGVLYGLATAGPAGAIEGAIAPDVTKKHFQQNEDMRAARVQTAQAQAASAKQNVQFESVKAADSHIQASKEATRIDQLNAESRAQVRQANDQHAEFLMNNFGIMPDLSLEGNGQEVHDQAKGGLQTLAGENGGQIPPIVANVQPHTDEQPKFKVGVYSPSQQDLQRNQEGWLKLINAKRAVLNQPPMDALTFNSGAGKGYQGQREMGLDAAAFFGLPKFSKESLPADLANWQQMRDSYQNHKDASGNPDADPQYLQALSRNVDFLSKAQDAVNAATNKQAADEEAAKQKAALPYQLARTKAEEAVKDGDPKAAGQLLVNGDVAPSQLVSARKPAFAQQAFTEAHKLDPTWNAQAAEGYYKTAGSPQNVQFFGSAKSLTDQGGTLDQLHEAYSKLPNGRLPSFNKVSDFIAAAAGSGPVAGFAQTAIGVADDYSKVMGGGQGSDSSRNQVLDSFAMSHSPQGMAAAIAAARRAVDSQMQSRIGKNPVMRKMYGDQMLVHVSDPKGGDHVFRTQEQADSFKKQAGIQ